MMQAAAPAGYDEEVAPPVTPKGYDEEVAPPASLEATSTGITVPKGMVGGSVTGPNSIVGGFARQGAAAVKGLVMLGAPPEGAGETAVVLAGGPGALPVYRAGKGLVEAEKTAAGQVKEQAGKGQYVRAGVTGLSMLDPLATGPVTNINKLESEGKGKEATGAGLFDIFSLLLGKRTGKEPTSAKTVNKLAYATGAESIRPLEHLLPDIQETIKQHGPPQTVGQLYNTIQQTSSRLENQFNISLQQMGTQPIHTQAIADALKAKADALPRSAALEAKALRQEARLYDGQVTTARELNADRMYRADNLQSFYKRDLTGQMAAARSSAQTMADKIVYDGARDILYNEMDQRFPGQDFQELKRKQSSVLDMLGNFKDHVERLEATQAKRAGAPVGEKAQVSASAHPGGSVITPRFHGLMNLLPGGGPLTRANAATQAAFSPTASALARRAAILSLPMTSIYGRGPAIPPPPQSGEGEEGPQQ